MSIGYGRQGSSYLQDVVVGADGTVYPLSNVDRDPFGDDYSDILVTAFRPDGRRLWAAAFAREGRSEEISQAIAVDDTRGRVYVTGFTYRPVGRPETPS